jgi:hypothetical protein
VAGRRAVPDGPARTWRERKAGRQAEDAAALWRFQRAVARVGVVDDILADYATSYCGRPLRRHEVAPMESAVQVPGVTWSIDGDVMVEFLASDRGPGRLVVHEIALLTDLRKRLRSRHVLIEHGSAWRSTSGHVVR